MIRTKIFFASPYVYLKKYREYEKPSYLNLVMHTIVMIFLGFFFRFEYPPDLHQYSGYYDDQYGYYSDYNGHRWDPHIQQWVQQTAGIVYCPGPGPKWAGFNLYKPSVLFVGHRQTVQAHIRRHILWLHRLHTECSIEIWKNVKNTTQNP